MQSWLFVEKLVLLMIQPFSENLTLELLALPGILIEAGR
jgi:hypothetical protein